VVNALAWGEPPDRVVAAAASTPSELLGLGDRGRLEQGLRADVVVIARGGVRAVWRAGERLV
jgi:alpha-D-ribose 1-methylphosphonate 5-triphosphate diphosphatase PhnM